MNDRSSTFDPQVAAFLRDEAGAGSPDYLDDILRQTARNRQRPAWTSIERWLPVDILANRPVIGRSVPWRPIGALVAFALLLAALVAVMVASRPRLPEPFGLASNGAVAFWRDGDIWLAEADGSNERLAIGGPTDDLAPWFSPDGTRFTFHRVVSRDETQLMVADAGGGNVRELAPVLRAPDWTEWSPSGAEVAVLHTIDRARVVTIYDAARVAAPRTIDVGNLDVSNALWWLPPDGDQLIFRATPRGRTFEPAIYRVGADGTGLERITALGTNEYQYQDVTLSSDGRTAAYWSWEADDSDDAMGGYLHTLDLVTGEQLAHELTRGEKWIRPHFSPDGRTLAVVTNIEDTQRVAIASLDGGEPRMVGPVITTDTSWRFMFSPDGKKLAVNVEGEETWLVDLVAGGEGKRTGIDYFAAWQRLAP